VFEKLEYCALNSYSICKYLCITTGLLTELENGRVENGWFWLVDVSIVFSVTQAVVYSLITFALNKVRYLCCCLLFV